ncbi:hypothetical protein NIE88_19995 [Sporolactobacillus shoreicorticis]|uniref:Lipoprotein n=1 Tax=Sporolactobacillus shoreicorticis TaxID=1923877 RepID=A0ABW5S314_9BACL|nr:hypothetical protein [Sporolactobacillus shoreicorticis]MCO7128028.1 hypothetical protein [Sporolactobacillus shoreicorticis]
MYKFLAIGILLLLLFAGCAHEKRSTDVKQVQLNAALVKGLKHGEITGTPLSLNDGFRLADVKKAWGEPDRHIDREEVQSYVYKKNGQTFQIDDAIETDDFKDQKRFKYRFVVHLKISREKIVKAMNAAPKINGKRLLQYQYNGHIIQFEQDGTKNNWLMFYRNASQSDMEK